MEVLTMETSLTQITDYLLTQSGQIAILVVVIAAINFALRNKSAHVRYLLWLIVLAKCLAPPLLTIPLAILPQQEQAELSPMASSTQARPLQHDVTDATMAESTDLRSAPLKMARPPIVERKWRDISTRAWLVIVWIVGAGVFLMFNLLRAIRASFWLWRYRERLPAKLRNDIEALFTHHDIKRFPDVWLVKGFNQPFVWGLLRGSIYLPVNFLNINRPEHQRSVLGHEFSHVLRFDAAVNILQVIAQALFWFHPLVWWANRKIRAEREKCCDEMAVARLNTSPRDYSTAILETLAAKSGHSRPIPSLAVAGPVKNIEERIRTMLRPGKKFYNRPSSKAATVVMLIAFLIVPTAFVLTVRAGTEGTSTPLHKAVNAGDIERVKSFISKGADVNAKDEKDNTPLHLVAKYGYDKQNIAELLIARGAEVNARNNEGWTPLHFTAWRSYTGHRNIAELLIAKNADTNARDKDGCIPLHYAAGSGSKKMIELLLANGSEINSKDKSGSTALCHAIDWAKGDSVEILLANGADVNIKDKNNYTPLHHAARKNNNLVKMLIEGGADIDARDSEGYTPLHYAALRGAGEIVETLLARGADMDAKTGDGATPLHYAAYDDRKGVVEIFLAKGANVNAKTDAGDTPASAALLAEHRDIFDLLIAKGGNMPASNSLFSVAKSGNLREAKHRIEKGADVNATDWRGWTALHYAASAGNTDIIKLLASKGANVNVQNKEGLTPLHLATDLNCAQALIIQNADVNIQNNDGWAPLHCAARDGRLELAKILIDAGANVNPNNICRKPLHWAVKNGHTSIVKLLIEKGGDVNADDCHSDKPLHYTVWGKPKKEAAILLLDNGADPDSRDLASWAPLHYAAVYGHKAMADLLVTRGADINLNTGWSETPLSLAKKKGHAEIVELLEKRGAKE